ncbi:MAG: rifampicin phosphotransferase, partial [Acidimicrobiaceae bacterium]|nr:rifampicin phosphotransferase [Acidimicrobiaceae bacterium]
MDRFFTDNDPDPRYPIYTRANAGEVMPEPVSPLSTTLGMLNGGDLGWRDAYVRFGTFDPVEIEGDNPVAIGQFGGYLYLNMSCTRIYGVRMPGLTPEMVDFQYFGEMPGIPPYSEEARPTDESPEHTLKLASFLNDYIFGRDDLPELRKDRDDVDAFIATRPDLSTASNGQLVQRARDTMPWYRRLFDQHIGVSAGSGVGIGTVAGICQAIGRPELTMTLIAGVGEVDSAAPSWAMWDMGRTVAASADLTAEFNAGVTGLLDRIRASSSPDADAFLKAFDEFLTRFGARGPDEWEFRSRPWGVRPELPLAAIDRMRLAGEDAAPQTHTDRYIHEREEATKAVLTALEGNDEALGQFQAGLRSALLFSAGRERSKTNNIKIVHEVRVAMRELGRRMVEAGHLDNIEQVFMLVDDELDAFVADPASFSDIVRQREEQYLALFDLEPPFIVYKTVPPMSEWRRKDRADMDKSAVGTVLSGIPGCPGKARGRARVVL